MAGQDEPNRPIADRGAPGLPAPPTLPGPTGDAAVMLPPRLVDPVSGRPSGSDHEATPFGRAPADDHQPVVLGRSRVLEAPEPVRLRRSTWASGLFLVVAIVGVPAQLIGSIASLAADSGSDSQSVAAAVSGLASLLLLAVVLAWTWVDVDNARRLLTHSRHKASVSPWRAVFWWLAAPVIGIALLGLGRVVLPDDVRSEGVTGDAEVVRAFLFLGWVLVVLILAVRPYLYLGHVMKRIHGDPTLFTRWLWVSVLAGALSGLAVVAFRFAAFDAGDTKRAVLAALVVGALILPYLTWCVMGRRALGGMDAIARARSAGQFEQRRVYLETEGRSRPNEVADAPFG